MAGGGDEEESVLALSDGHFATREHWARAYANTWDGTLPTTLNYYEHMVNQDNQCVSLLLQLVHLDPDLVR